MKEADCIHDCGNDTELEVQVPVESGRPTTKVNATSGGHKGRIIIGIMEPVI